MITNRQFDFPSNHNCNNKSETNKCHRSGNMWNLALKYFSSQLASVILYSNIRFHRITIMPLMFADRCRWANRVLIEWQQQFPVFIWMILLGGSQWWHVQKKTNHKKQLGFSHPNRKVNKLADSDLLSGKGLL